MDIVNYLASNGPSSEKELLDAHSGLWTADTVQEELVRWREVVFSKTLKNGIQVYWTQGPLTESQKLKMSLKEEIQTLGQELQTLENRIQELNSKRSHEYSDSDVEQTLSRHITLLHEYNEVKDVGQMLLGKYAEMQGTTTSKMYEQFGLELDA